MVGVIHEVCRACLAPCRANVGGSGGMLCWGHAGLGACTLEYLKTFRLYLS